MKALGLFLFSHRASDEDQYAKDGIHCPGVIANKGREIRAHLEDAEDAHEQSGDISLLTFQQRLTLSLGKA
jgi:hypothetical protein